MERIYEFQIQTKLLKAKKVYGYLYWPPDPSDEYVKGYDFKVQLTSEIYFWKLEDDIPQKKVVHIHQKNVTGFTDDLDNINIDEDVIEKFKKETKEIIEQLNRARM